MSIKSACKIKWNCSGISSIQTKKSGILMAYVVKL